MPGAARLLAAALLVSLAAGCVQLETRVALAEDGSVTVTERLRFSRMLLDLAGPQREELLALLGREAALARMAEMGEGVTLVSHEMHDAAAASRESVAVFRKAELSGLRCVSPWPAYADFASNNVVEFRLYPLYKSNAYGDGMAGTLAVQVRHVKGARGSAATVDPDPIDAQVARDLGPIARDMLREFEWRLIFESYCPVQCRLGVRDGHVGARQIDLIHVTDQNLDPSGYPFFANEEVMLDLVRGDVGSPDVVRCVQGASGNRSLPLFTPFGSPHMWWTGGQNIWFPPSRPLFDRYFTDKKLDFSEWQAAPPEKHVLATYERVGWIPPKTVR